MCTQTYTHLHCVCTCIHAHKRKHLNVVFGIFLSVWRAERLSKPANLPSGHHSSLEYVPVVCPSLSGDLLPF